MRIQTAGARGKLPSQALAHEQHHNVCTHICLVVYDLLSLAFLSKLPFNHVSKHSLNIVLHNSTPAAYCFICEKEQCSDSSRAFPEQIAMISSWLSPVNPQQKHMMRGEKYAYGYMPLRRRSQEMYFSESSSLLLIHTWKMKGSLLVKLAHGFLDFFFTQPPLSPSLASIWVTYPRNKKMRASGARLLACGSQHCHLLFVWP